MTFPNTLGTFTWHKTAVIKKESQQIQVIIAYMATSQCYETSQTAVVLRVGGATMFRTGKRVVIYKHREKSAMFWYL